MKLIDAEKVVHEYYKNPSYQQLCKVLNDAPTVEAIPVDWIKTEAQQMLIDREISDKEMKCIKKLIKKWVNRNR